MTSTTGQMQVGIPGPDFLDLRLEQFGEFRDALERERDFRTEQLAHPGAAHAGSHSAVAEVQAAVLDGARRVLSDIDAALEAMREGHYGRCRGCAAPIPMPILKAIPRARLCPSCQAVEDGLCPGDVIDRRRGRPEVGGHAGARP